MQIDTAGFEELDRELATLGTEIATKIGEKAFKDSAAALQQAWIEGAPFRPGRRLKYWTSRMGWSSSADYGHLRDNIRVRRVKAQKQSAIVYAVHTGDAFWAYFLEFGTVAMRAMPWARPIIDRMKDRLVKIQVVVFNQGIMAAAARIERKTRAAKRKAIGKGRDHNSV
ncbi:HK97-gp10 family putative phage morphogenesis protein [Sphingomonas sp.]|uniref:HK97-gp10 family putative phage morphogenesis protein n=1 Tax=Sphingomonas sp. TaxID=28214 RepID=UPI003B3AFE22